MSDEQDEPHTTPAANEAQGPGFPLTGRLLSRATHSLGLIDVRAAERHYARIMDWLAARTPLVEHLRTRYGLTEGEGSPGLAFAEPRGAEVAHAGGEGINLSAAPGSFTAPAAEQIFTRVAHVPDEPDAAPPEAKRIARRGMPTFSPASPESGAGASRGRGAVVLQEQGEVFEPASELTVPTREQARNPQSPPPVTETPAATAESPGSRAADAAQESNASHARRTRPSVEERATASTAEQDKPLTRGGAPFEGTPESSPLRPTSTNEAPGANNPTGAAKPGVPRVAESRVAESTGADAVSRVPAPSSTRAREGATGAAVVNEAEGSALNRSGAAEGAKGVAGKAEGTAAKGAGVKLPVAGETRAAAVSFEAPRPLAQARERRAPAGAIHAGDSVRASEDLPGRASENLHAPPPLPLAPSPAAFERAEPARRPHDAAHAVTRAPSSDVTETFTPGHTRTQARADEVNIPRLAEQVSRHLTRRLLVERERRGLGKR